MEIERKFKVKFLPELSNYPFYEITQMYLSNDLDIRIRKKDDEYFITRKSNGTIARQEEETSISKEAYHILSNLLVGREIAKTRYLIPLDDGLVAELDIYHENLEGLLTVEVEFKSLIDAQNFILPLWFGEEITEDERYKNKNLAKEDIKPFIRKRSLK